MAKRTPQTHGKHYKYLGKIQATKLLKLLVFNYLFSNGDAHFKNFSILETPMGDYRLSPAYDLPNSRIHMADKGFALKGGLFPKNPAKGKAGMQFSKLAEIAGINEKIFKDIFALRCSQSHQVEKLIAASFLEDSTKRNYWQSYQGRVRQLEKI